MDWRAANTCTTADADLSIKIYLQGAYNSSTGLMNDHLRANNLIAPNDPYGRGKAIADMNILNTRDFFSQAKRNQAVEEVRQAMNTRLQPEGIIIDAVIYKDHRFERYMGENQEPDRSYQKQIDETQAKRQETEREEKRRAAIIQQKGKHLVGFIK